MDGMLFLSEYNKTNYLKRFRNRTKPNFFKEIAIKRSPQLDEIFSLILSNNVRCISCNKDITSLIQIICFSCNVDNPLCIMCFLSKHTVLHSECSYCVLPKRDPLFTSKWTFKEEFDLLTEILKNGIDNWDVISTKIKTKTPMECEAHYYVFYCDKEKMTEKVVMSQSNIQDKKYILQKNEKDECDYILKLMEQKRKIPDKAELNKTQSTIEYELGFQSKRNDFDYKYDDQAELAISDLIFSDEMTQEEINNNYKLLEQYNKLLDKREILEQFVIEWEFLNKESIDSNYINTMLNKYKFMLDKETFTQLVNCIKERISIAHKINQLKNN